MRERFEITVESSVDGYEVRYSDGEGTVGRAVARDLDQAMRMAAAGMAWQLEEKLSFP